MLKSAIANFVAFNSSTPQVAPSFDKSKIPPNTIFGISSVNPIAEPLRKMPSMRKTCLISFERNSSFEKDALEFNNTLSHENVFTHFKINFEEISLIDLVSFQSVKNYLGIAQKLLEKDDFKSSIENISIAFYSLLESYEENKIGNYKSSPFFFGKDLTFNDSFFMGIKDKEMASFIDNVRDSLEEMQRAIKIISLGIDYKKFVKFNYLTPQINRTIEGQYHIHPTYEKKKWTKENCQYCINFIIDSSLKLQEFNFDINEIEVKN